MRNLKQKDKEKEIAINHVHAMFLEAEKQASQNIELSNKLIDSSLQILMKFRLRIPSVYKTKFCKNCKTFFIPGVNCRVRTHKCKIIYHCFKCKSFIRKNITPKKITKTKC